MPTVLTKVANSDRWARTNYRVDSRVTYWDRNGMRFGSAAELVEFVEKYDEGFRGIANGLQYEKVAYTTQQSVNSIVDSANNVNPIGGFTDWRLPTITEAKVIAKDRQNYDDVIWVTTSGGNLIHMTAPDAAYKVAANKKGEVVLVRDTLNSDNYLKLQNAATYKEACEIIDRLNEETYGGYLWRLPNEDDSILDIGAIAWLWTGMKAPNGSIVVCHSSSNRDSDILVDVEAHPYDCRTVIAVRVGREG